MPIPTPIPGRGQSKAPRRSAAEIIAFHFSTDIASVREGRYQPGRTGPEPVYVVGDDYWCAPKATRPPPDADKFGFNPWQEVACYYGRKVWRSPCSVEAPTEGAKP